MLENASKKLRADKKHRVQEKSRKGFLIYQRKVIIDITVIVNLKIYKNITILG